MEINIQYKIKNTKNYYQLLKENSEWIKYLNRSSSNYDNYIEYLKDKYELRITDKISNAIDNIDLINTLLNAIK